MSRWYFQPILDSYWTIAALAMGMALLLLIPAFGQLTRGQRGVLLVLRGLVFLLVTLAMLRPTHVSTQSRPQASTLIVLLDRSRSMDGQVLVAVIEAVGGYVVLELRQDVGQAFGIDERSAVSFE